MSHTQFLRELKALGLKPYQGNRLRFKRERKGKKTRYVEVSIPMKIQEMSPKMARRAAEREYIIRHFTKGRITI